MLSINYCNKNRLPNFTRQPEDVIFLLLLNQQIGEIALLDRVSINCGLAAF